MALQIHTVFADASFWIALFSKQDDHHGEATEIMNRLRSGRFGFPDFLTSDYVLHEILNAFLSTKTVPYPTQLELRKARAKKAVAYVTGVCRVLAVNGTQWGVAVEAYYHGQIDKDYGVTDCVSFHLMDQQGVPYALAFDHHFSQAGRVVVSESSLI